MSHRLLQLVYAGVSILVLHPAFAQHETSLDRFHAEYRRALEDETVERLLPFYSEEVRVMPEYHGTLFGAANARAYLTAFFERFKVQDYERERLRIFDLGARVMDVGRFKMKLISSAGAHELAGKYAEVWRNTNGQLSLLAQIWNYDAYPANANELRFANVPGVRVAFEPHVAIKDGLSFEIAALNKLQEAAIVEKDGDLWSQFYSDDALLLINHAREQVGRSAIDQYINDHVRQMPIYEKLDIRHDELDPVGPHVVDYASHIAI